MKGGGYFTHHEHEANRLFVLFDIEFEKKDLVFYM